MQLFLEHKTNFELFLFVKNSIFLFDFSISVWLVHKHELHEMLEISELIIKFENLRVSALLRLTRICTRITYLQRVFHNKLFADCNLCSFTTYLIR